MFNKKSELIDFIKENKKESHINLFFDIETLCYNKHIAQSTKHPTDYKNISYSFAVGHWQENELKVYSFFNFPEFVTFLTQKITYKKLPTIKLIGFNSNKYDNHFLFREARTYLKSTIKCYNMTNGTRVIDDRYETPEDQVTKEEKKEGVFFEKRIKAGNNLHFKFFYKNLIFETRDLFPMFQIGLKTVGTMLNRAGALTDEETKTDFDYLEFDRRASMTDAGALDYARRVYDRSLTDSHKKYIRNDIVILAKAYRHYDTIFPGFNVDNWTKTKNIIDTYVKDNELARLHLLNKITHKGVKVNVNYTNFLFAGMNFYDYLRRFFKGGLNLYNDIYLGTKVQDVFAMDESSAYPHAMYGWDVPTFIRGFASYDVPKMLPVLDENFTLYEVSKADFNRYVLEIMPSQVIRKAIVKYYANFHENVYVNSFTLKVIREVGKLDVRELPVKSWITFDSIPFGGKDKIYEYYAAKTQAKLKDKIVFNDTPYDYKIVKDDGKREILSDGEVYLAKVNMNGIYGAPALAPVYDTFYRDAADKVFNMPNNFSNTERNILFSLFVTAVSFYNLLKPLSCLTPEEIDDNFVYCDTDSLFIKNKVRHKFNPTYFDNYALGKWVVDNEKIDNIYVLNHKKYVYETDGKITIKSGGIRHAAFDTNMCFDKFIESQFHDGAKIMTQKSLTNRQGVISIYEAETTIEQGRPYSSVFAELHTRTLRDIAYTARGELHKSLYDDKNFDDVLYVETAAGTLSRTDLMGFQHTREDRMPLKVLQKVHCYLQKNLL